MYAVRFANAVLYIAAASLAACGALREAQGSMPSVGTLGTMPQSRVPNAVARWHAPYRLVVWAQPTHRDHGPSWMSPEAKTIKRLLYISDQDTDDVFVYNYASRKMLGKITGFNYPYGQCVDKRGDVWIANFMGQSSGQTGSVAEYRHGGTELLKVFYATGYPIGCAVDPMTGNLAVANYYSPGSGTGGIGSVDVFSQASGARKTFSNGKCAALWPPAYDQSGNLFAEGLSAESSGLWTGVCELRAAGRRLAARTTEEKIWLPGSAMWDGKYVTLTDQEYQNGDTTAIYQINDTTRGRIRFVGTTILEDHCSGNGAKIAQPFAVGKQNTPSNVAQAKVVVGGNLDCTGRFDYWRYTAGGDPKFSLSAAPQKPYGESVSIRN